MTPVLDYYESAPAWLKSAIALTIVYLSYRIWSRILRTRREVQAASWILSQRRRAGIPDSDKRPFKIAKAAVEATRTHSTTTQTPSTSPLPAPPPQQTTLQVKSKQLTSPSDPLDCPPEKLHPRLTTHSKPSSHTFDHSNQTHQTTTRTHEPNKQDRHTPAPSSLKPDHAARKTKSNKPLIDKSNQKRVAPISSDGSDSEHSETEPERSASRNRKKKARTQHDRPNPATASLHLNRELASIESSTATTTNDQSNGTNPNGFKDVQRKKRILSDCVSEVDADQAMRIKKGRSEKLSDLNRIRDPRRTPEVEDLMRVDKDEEEQVEEKEDEDEAEGGNAEKQSDQELYIIADDGRRKKLVKIRLGSPESADSQEENNVEQRWVTHKEFRRLKEDHQLLMDNDQWDSESTISSSDSFDSDSNRLSTPSKQTAERGPIWSIEGKPRPNPILPATELPLRVRPVSRPRNSLGRMRLSLPPDPASPSQLPRSRLISPLRPSVS
ncbi:hypothetical protein PTTG_03992 [Puccinia triticina 1-1 BBBD Race 1]|uniref:Uncharacterized protein n=1 Tax=Puccinia triticina (isolate 1-1 / race 1 (BBBD)) TaxID=630390 RepID=A0A180G0G2_PUCT1|nr:hypothetical protein PTTG_03992 [Puccinia triticina 1-1 BBBD Race 1]